METLYEKASLILNPGVYDSGKVYATKPFDGSGDLTFTRASNATRVASNGLIEKVRTNLTLHSEDATDSVYVKTNLTVTANSTTAPDGTLTADTITATATNGNIQGVVTITSGLVYTMSVWLKRKTGTGTIQLRGVSNTSTTVTITNDWARYSVSLTASDIFGRYGVLLQTSGDEVYCWGFQLETGDIATDYIATTTTAVSVGPVSGLPRLDYLNSSCPRLLLEPQRTSNVQFSEAFDNAYWSKPNVTLTSTLGGPIDQSKYFTITCDGTAGTFKGVRRTFINASANTYTLSVFAKAGNSSTFVVSSRATLTDNDVRAIFNLSNGTITDTNGGTAAIVPYGDGWYRCSFTVVNAGTFSNESSIFFGHPFGAADGATVLATGAMSEIGAYPSSYLPTLSTSVTRNADAASKTGITSLIGQTEGTVFTELDVRIIVPTPSPRRPISLEAGTDVNSLILNFATTGAIQTVLGGVTRDTGLNVSSTNGVVKIAIAYSASGFVIFVNGILRDTYTGAWTQPTWSSIGVGGSVNTATREFGDRVAQALLFKTRLTNAQMAELTTI
jgi:hypothetical protein